jgi:small subunit ribosomal protein S8
MLTDPIADLLTRLRNAQERGHEKVDMPSSKMKLEIARVLKKEGFIKDYRVMKDGPHAVLKVILKYAGENKGAITALKRVSKPGRRIYVERGAIPKVLGGLGLAILSTSKGVLTDAEARTVGVGGEVLCEVW